MEFYKSKTSTECWEQLYHNYLTCLNKLAPFITICPSKQKEDWVSNELLDLIRKREQFKLKADTMLQNEDFEKFKEFRNKARRKAISSKLDFIKSKLTDTNINSKKYWSELGRLCPVGKKSDRTENEIITLKNESGTELDINTIPNEFNNFFSTVGLNLAKLITVNNENCLQQCKTAPDYEGIHEFMVGN